MRRSAVVSLWILALAFGSAANAQLAGRILDAESGAPIVGARVTAERGDPAYRITGFSAEDGTFALPLPPGDGAWRVSARRIGWEDVRREGVLANGALLALRARRHTDPAEVAAQLPANHWYALALARPGPRRPASPEARVHLLPSAGRAVDAARSQRGRLEQDSRADGSARRDAAGRASRARADGVQRRVRRRRARCRS